MTIHHNTARRATANSIELAETDGEYGLMVRAVFDPKRPALFHRDPKLALDAALLARTLWTEYAVALKATTEARLVAYSGDTMLGEYGFTPSLADVLDDLAEVDDTAFDQQDASDDEDEGHGDAFDTEDAIDGAEYDEEARTPVSVVPDVYRQMYAERGNPNHCGDWLAQTLDGAFLDGTGAFDVDLFIDTCVLNDVKLGQWANTSGRGFKGRVRMNGRQKLEVQIALTGRLMLSPQSPVSIAVPKEVLESLRVRHARALRKQTLRVD